MNSLMNVSIVILNVLRFFFRVHNSTINVKKLEIHPYLCPTRPKKHQLHVKTGDIVNLTYVFIYFKARVDTAKYTQ